MFQSEIFRSSSLYILGVQEDVSVSAYLPAAVNIFGYQLIKSRNSLQYYSYRFANRGDFNFILYGKSLLLQFLVDAYEKVEEARLIGKYATNKRCELSPAVTSRTTWSRQRKGVVCGQTERPFWARIPLVVHAQCRENY